MRDTDRPLRGILYINVALIFMAGNDALIRFLTSDFSPVQIAFIRVLVMAILVGGVILSLRRYHLFLSRRYGLLALRGILSAGASVSFFFSLEYLELADAFTVSMAGPIIVAALSGWFLGERVPALRWGAIVLGFFGIAVVMRPGEGLFNVWAFLALLSAALYAVAMMLNRKLTETEDSLTILFYMAVSAGIVLLPVMAFVWKSTPLVDLPLLFVVGLLSGITQYLLVQAYRYAAASTVITFDYFSVVYVAVVGYLAFAEVPTWNLLFGVVILIASGLLIVHEEMRQKRMAEEIGG